MAKISRMIHRLIQNKMDEMNKHWSEFSEEQWQEKRFRYKQCEELQAEIEKTFPDDFPQKGA